MTKTEDFIGGLAEEARRKLDEDREKRRIESEQHMEESQRQWAMIEAYNVIHYQVEAVLEDTA